MELCGCVSDDCGHGEGVGTYPTLVVEKFQDDDTGCPRVVHVGVMKMWMEVHLYSKFSYHEIFMFHLLFRVS
jgi:hypothetical protein